ncbi:MAG: response regulator [Nitrososphaeraceae archaeon]|nr:response regulator [Nitrososphaeraceae archaeon]
MDLIKAHGNTNNDYTRSSILVVDDEPDIARLIVQWLDRDGFKVSAFTDPAMALEDFKLNCNTCSLILSDIRMPGMNGYEFIKKTKEIDKQAKVILMSSFEIEDKEFHNVLSDIKVDAFIQKPFTLRELRDIVQKNSVAAAMQ